MRETVCLLPLGRSLTITKTREIRALFESIAGSEHDEDTEVEHGESAHDVMNFTQRSRLVSHSRSCSPSISPARFAPEEIEFPELLRFVAQISPFTVGPPTSAKQG